MVVGQLFNNKSMLMSVLKGNGMNTNTDLDHLQTVSGSETIVFTTLQRVHSTMLSSLTLLTQTEQGTSLRTKISASKTKAPTTLSVLALHLI